MHSTRDLARFFGVSRQAMTVRLSQTNLRASSHGLTATESLKRAFDAAARKPYRRTAEVARRRITYRRHQPDSTIRFSLIDLPKGLAQ